MGKNTPQRRIDAPRQGDGARDADVQSVHGGAILGAPVIDTPTNVTWVTTYIDVSDYTSLATVELSWRYDSSTPPDMFLIQWSTSSTFADATTGSVAGTMWSATLRGLPTGTTLYVRVAARRGGVTSPWSAAISGVTASDTSPLAAVTALQAVWDVATGDVTITWAPPADRRYKHTVLTIKDADSNAVLRTTTAVAERYVWTYAQQAQDTSGAFVFSITITAQPVTTRDVFGPTSSVTITAPMLSAPTGVTTSWSGDTGTAEADCLISWQYVSGARYYEVSINSIVRSVGYVNQYLYTYEQNQRENGGDGAPSLSITVAARDVYNRSAATTVSATNAVPPAPTAPSVQAFFSGMRLTWPATPVRDARHLLLQIERDGTTIATYTLSPPTTTYTFDAEQTGMHRARLAVVDLFTQQSAWSAWSSSVSLTSNEQFLQELRAGVLYRDSVNTPTNTLNVLKDNNTTSGGVTYAPSSSWRWIECNHGREIRHRTTTLAISAAIAVYLGVSKDGSTWTWYTGGTVAGSVWSPVVQLSESSAQTNALTLGAGTYRIQLPSPQQVQFIRIYFLNPSESVQIDEFYPRALVQSDDIEAEAIRAIHVAAASITADKLLVNDLSAISANLGTVTAGSITGVTITGTTITGSTITGSTITGGVFYTAATPPRVEIDNNGFRFNNGSDATVRIDISGPDSGALICTTAYINLLNTGRIFVGGQNFDIARLGTLTSGHNLIIGGLTATSERFGMYFEGDGQYAGVDYNALTETVSLFRQNTRIVIPPPSNTRETVDFYTEQVRIIPRYTRHTELAIGTTPGNYGDLVFARSSAIEEVGVPRWILHLHPNDSFLITSRNNDGSYRHVIFFSERFSGHVGIGGIPDVPGGNVGSTDVYGDLVVRGRIRPKQTWTSITLEDNWQDCGNLTGDPSVAYLVMPDGTVHFRGAIRRTSGSSQRLFTMPTDLQGSVIRRMVVSYRLSGTSVVSAAHISYYPSLTYGVFFDGPQIVNSSGTTLEGVVFLWGIWNLLG